MAAARYRKAQSARTIRDGAGGRAAIERFGGTRERPLLASTTGHDPGQAFSFPGAALAELGEPNRAAARPLHAAAVAGTQNACR
jgi:hypothetical protein